MHGDAVTSRELEESQSTELSNLGWMECVELATIAKLDRRRTHRMKCVAAVVKMARLFVQVVVVQVADLAQRKVAKAFELLIVDGVAMSCHWTVTAVVRAVLFLDCLGKAVSQLLEIAIS